MILSFLGRGISLHALQVNSRRKYPINMDPQMLVDANTEIKNVKFLTLWSKLYICITDFGILPGSFYVVILPFIGCTDTILELDLLFFCVSVLCQMIASCIVCPVITNLSVHLITKQLKYSLLIWFSRPFWIYRTETMVLYFTHDTLRIRRYTHNVKASIIF